MSEDVKGLVVALVFLAAIAVLVVCVIKHEEIFEWVKSKFSRDTNKLKNSDLHNWYRSEVKLGLDFAANGVIIKAYNGGRYDGDMMTTTHTRVAHDASEIGDQVMALLAEIQLGK